MTQHSQFALLGTRRFLPFFVTQLLGAFNDNIFKQALILAILFKLSVSGDRDLLVNLCAMLFILPFFLFSATAGQIAEKLEKSRLIRITTTMEIAIMSVAGLGFLLLLVFVNTRFNYYEVNAREILHHHGYLGDIQRWSTEGLEMNKEIYDVVEYLLLRSGRLIFQPATSKKAIVLDNVAGVNRIEKEVNDLLSVVAVRLNQRPGPG